MNPIQTTTPATRPVPSGTLTLAAGTADSYLGQNSMEPRFQFIISNLDAANILKIQTANHKPLCTVQPATTQTLFTDADLEVFNPNGAEVQYEVSEFFIQSTGARSAIDVSAASGPRSAAPATPQAAPAPAPAQPNPNTSGGTRGDFYRTRNAP